MGGCSATLGRQPNSIADKVAASGRWAPVVRSNPLKMAQRAGPASYVKRVHLDGRGGIDLRPAHPQRAARAVMTLKERTARSPERAHSAG